MHPDEYTVIAPIGKGSFGLVHKVQRRSDGAVLCRKEILWGRMSSREREQLQQELSILRDLQHPNIVQYITDIVDPETKIVHIFMEYCGNGDLGDMIRQYRDSHRQNRLRVPESVVWQIFCQATSALHRCHSGAEDDNRQSRLVLHRDIKPQNIFLDHNNRVKLGDFGLSKQISGPDLAETYVGTPFYMSPELIAGKRYNSKSDIWALGCVVYELCALTTPFYAESQEELNRKIRAGHVASLERLGYSAGLNTAVRSCLVRDEASRPSAATLLKLPEMVLARQVQANADRETILIQREAELVVREKQVERAIREKQEEFQRREEELQRGSSLVSELQMQLAEAHRQIEQMVHERQLLESPALTSAVPAPRPQRVSMLHRPSLGRAQTTSGEHNLRSPVRRKSQIPMSRVRGEVEHVPREPLNVIHQPTGTKRMSAVKPDLQLHIPSRPSSRQAVVQQAENVRPHSATGMADRHVLIRHNTYHPGTTGGSLQDLARGAEGTPNSARRARSRSPLPMTPTRELSMRALNLGSGGNSARKLAMPSPTRNTRVGARTLFNVTNIGDERPASASPILNRHQSSGVVVRKQDFQNALQAVVTKSHNIEGVVATKPHRSAPPAPPVHRQLPQKDTRRRLPSDDSAMSDDGHDYDDEDMPSPFIKRQYLVGGGGTLPARRIMA